MNGDDRSPGSSQEICDPAFLRQEFPGSFVYDAQADPVDITPSQGRLPLWAFHGG